MTKNFLQDLTLLTKTMIDELPICDIHVHLPGVISPQIAWDLGVRNKFISVVKEQNGEYTHSSGPQSLSILDPHEHYIDIFKSGFILDENGKPQNLEYNIDADSFKDFDRIMATTQGHRHPPGGIQTKDDMMFLLDSYLEDCVRQKIFYTELQQNIKIAYLLFPDDEAKDARKKLYLLFKDVIEKFKQKGIHLRFLHCFNKTKAAGDEKTTHERTLEAAGWLEETQEIAPNVFVGIESAGHEKDESGWPVHLKAGYEKVRDLGLGCEAHGGEGIGVEHMLDVAKSLPITRLAHGFQVIEDIEVIEFIKQKAITLIMMPIINLNLGLCLHVKQNDNNEYIPCAKTKGGKKIHIRDFWEHPFFELFRKHKMKITLSSDNPNIGGVPIKDTILALAGLSSKYKLPKQVYPLKAEELAILCRNGIDAIFSADHIKQDYKNLLNTWIEKHNLDQEFINNYYGQN
jgi:adenosine deaminase